MRAFTASIVITCVAATTQAVTLHVPGEYQTIQSAVDVAASGDVVLVADGIYTGSGNYDISLGTLQIEVSSENGAERTIIDCDGLGRGFLVEGSSTARVYIRGFTIRNGVSTAGGGLRVQDATATVENCIFLNNQAPHGGAIYINTAAAEVRFSGCQFIYNSSIGDTKDLGDGLGAAVFTQYGSYGARFTNSLFYGNHGDLGGALACGVGLSFVVTNCTIADNYVENAGAAIYFQSGARLQMSQSLLAFNKGASAFAMDGSIDATVSCSDVYGNQFGDWTGSLASYVNQWGNLSTDPGFCNLATGDYSYLPLSVCLPQNNSCSAYIGTAVTGACDVAIPLAIAFTIQGDEVSHVVVTEPMFSWTFYDHPYNHQVGSEIEVGIDDDWSEAEMWVSGPVMSGTPLMQYGGSPLQDGSDYYARIRLYNGTSWGAWVTYDFHTNSTPSRPVPFSPIDAAVANPHNIRLTVSNSSDTDDSLLTYDFEIFADGAMTVRVASVSGIPMGPAQTESGIMDPLEVDNDYWWRARASDGWEYSEWSDAGMFHTAINRVLNVPEDYARIGDAMLAAGPGDQVLVGPGDYPETVTYHLFAVSVKSRDGAEVTRLLSPAAGTPAVRVEVTGQGVPSLEGFTITGSTASGVRINDGASFVLTHCTVLNNSSGYGGGVHCSGTNVIIQDCLFQGNTVNSEGGGIFIKGSSVRIERCRFSGNTGGTSGAAVYSQLSDDLVLRGNVAYSNQAGSMGGGFTYVYQCNNVSFVNNTIVDNRSYDRGAITIWGGTGHVVRNNIIAFSTRGVGLYVNSAEVSADYNDVYGNVGNYGGISAGANDLSLNPAFVDATTRDYSLSDVSPCIDAGDPDNQYRDPDGTRNDMGALPTTTNLPIATRIHIPGEDSRHLINHTPTIEWEYLDDQSTTQAAYELEVGSDNDWTAAEMWSPGSAISNDNQAEYAGLPLSDGADYIVRIRTSDGTDWGDWRGLSMHMNQRPTVPVPYTPSGGVIPLDTGIIISTGNATDSESDPLTYDFELYADAALSTLVFTQSGVPQKSPRTASSAIKDLDFGAQYWWRVRTFDGYEYSDWSLVATFTVRVPQALRVPSQYASLSAAILASYHGDTVLVADGVYSGTYNRNLNCRGKRILVRSENGPATTVIDCSGANRAFIVGEGETNLTVLDGFTIRNGSATAGGAIFIQRSSMTVRNCIFEYNKANAGGAIHVDSPTEDPLIENCRFSHNDARASLTNLTDGAGGAIYAVGGYRRVLFAGCIFTGNTSDRGGALYCGSSMDLNLTGCTLADNRAISAGAAFYFVLRRKLEMTRSVVAFNQGGAAVACNPPLVTDMACNNIYGNSGGDWTDCLQPLLGVDGNISLDPEFCSHAEGEYSVRPYSPCASENNSCQILMGALGPELCPTELPIAKELNLGQENINRVAADQPVFFWEYVDVPAGTQSSFEIEVGTDPDWSTAEMWVSGEVSSTDPQATYAGLDLIEGQTYHARVRVSNGTQWGSWEERQFRMNVTPTVPAPVSPSDNQTLSHIAVTLVTDNSADLDGDTLVYEFEVYKDALLTELALRRSGVAQASPRTSIGPLSGFDAATGYWWRVRAHDRYEYSNWSPLAAFYCQDYITHRVPSQFTTIQAAVTAAASGDRILIADGVYRGAGNRDIELLGKALVIESESGLDQTIIDCERSGRAFYIHQNEDNRTVIRGFTLRNGTSTAGGAIRIQGASAKVENCLFEYNIAPHGGAVYINTAVAGPEFKACRFVNNSAIGNSKDLTDGYGGAIYCQSSAKVTLTDCLLARDSADFGGALSCQSGGGYTLIGCTIVDNKVENCGSGIYYYSTVPLVMTNSIVAFNYGSSGLYCGGSLTATITCSDIFGNSAGDWVGCIESFAGGNGNISVDPLFCARDGGEYSLIAASPCEAMANTCQALIGAMDSDDCEVALPLAMYPTLAGENLTHVINHNPQISWTYLNLPNRAQVACEVQAGTDHDWEVAEMWSSGSVATDQPSLVYAGQPLIDGADYWVRIRVADEAGWGDWQEMSFHMNYRPLPPSHQEPQPGAVFTASSVVRLTVANGFDAESDRLRYDFEVFVVSPEQPLFASYYNVTEQTDATTVGPLTGLTVLTDYVWRVGLYDGHEYSDWSEPQTFRTRGPGIIYVPSDYATIQMAVDASGPMDTIIVAPGDYREHIVMGVSTVLLQSSDGPDVTFVSANTSSWPGLNFPTGLNNSSVVEGFTFRNYTGASAVRIAGGNSPSIRLCRMVDNVGAQGSGVLCLADNVRVYGCTFTGNDGSLGTTSEGAAMYVRGKNVTIDSCYFVDNATVRCAHGALCVKLSDNVTITRSVGFGNGSTSLFIGFIYAEYCTGLRIVGNTIVDNSSNASGAGITLTGCSNAVIDKNIVAFNRGSYGLWASQSSATLSCNSAFGNPTGDYYGITPDPQSINADPLFCGFHSGVGDFSLQRQSPCMPANNSCGVLIGALGLGSDCTDYLCGDADGDRDLTWSDVDVVKDFYFGTGPAPDPAGSGDADCDGLIKLNDILTLVEFLRGTGPAPCCYYENKSDITIQPPTRPPIDTKREPLENQGSSDQTTE